MKILLSQLTKGFRNIENDCYITSVVTDSRQAGENSLFLAIKGERVNGEDFARQAIKNGAKFVVTEHFIENVPRDMQAVVPNVLDASIQMGANVRDSFDIDIIGVTGSVGKTTTKDFVYAALSPFKKMVKSVGNHNNELGMPNTIYTFTEEDKLAVLEMGMENLGDVHKLSMAARPVGAIITGIGISHLERLKTRENILKGKLEICDGMDENGVIALNGDDDFLPLVKLSHPKNVVYFAVDNKSADVVAEDIQLVDMNTEFVINDKKFGKIKCSIPTVGVHNVRDALSAYALATRLGYDPLQVAENLGGYELSGMRQKMVEKNGILFIEDCYNAAPDSMKASIDAMKQVAKGRTFAVLGDMLELGDDSEKYHFDVGEYAKKNGVDFMLTFGERAKRICRGFGADALNFDKKDDLADYLIQSIQAGDTVVFKASNSMKFYEIIEQVYKKL